MYNYYYDLTAYPKLYKSTYWGTFKLYEEKPDERLNKIIENRNNFIKEYISATEAAISLGDISKKKNISSVLNKKRKTAYGYKWKFKKV